MDRAARGSIVFRLLDELVRPVLLDLEDVEGGVQRVVGPRRPAERAAEDPVRNPDLLDVLDDRTPGRQRAVVCGARELGREQRDLNRTVGRRAERADLLARGVLL